MLKLLKYISIFLIFLMFYLEISCERGTNPANPNQVPNTTLANIPKENDTLFALLTLHWDGEDYDGFISGYQYRYITHHIFMGDSVIFDWVNTTQTSVTIPFESSDLLNFQKFEVRAIDDKGAIDPEPAQRFFYTVQTVFPETEIEIPQNNQQFFVIDHVTDWWEGVPLTYTATDQDGEVVEYAWRVDDGDWTWTIDTSLYIHPSYFEPLDGPHKIAVISRDNTNLVDPVGDSITVVLVKPTFVKDKLIIDEIDEALFTGGLDDFYNRDDLVDSFYTRIFNTTETWDFKTSGMPPKSLLGQYKLIIWHADNPYSNPQDVHQLPAHIEDVKDYLHVGGDLIMGGWRILKSFAQADPFPKTFEQGTFIHDYLHIVEADESSSRPDFVGCNPYPFPPYPELPDTLYIDTSKLADFPFNGKLYQINTMPRQAGFTEVMYVYANFITGIPTWRGQPVGLRYYGSVFDTIVLGFPMFFLKEEDARTMVSQMLTSLGLP
jgi:hypothetical protein